MDMFFQMKQIFIR